MSSQHSDQEQSSLTSSVSSSPTPSKKGFGVAASPFNGVKIELGIVLILGFVLWLATDFITASITAQLLLLVSYGLIGAFWLVIRTRRVAQQWGEQNNQESGPESDKTTRYDGRLNK
ncbi:MAG: hypothetical protein KAU29_01600 [Gammaproteobacteria bacterium]|nr:hypothetical protein [Gammaproteobacteria bacterium]